MQLKKLLLYHFSTTAFKERHADSVTKSSGVNRKELTLARILFSHPCVFSSNLGEIENNRSWRVLGNSAPSTPKWDPH